MFLTKGSQVPAQFLDYNLYKSISQQEMEDIFK